jgi:hypothetical protein
MKRFTISILLLAVVLATVFTFKAPETLAYPIIEGYIKNINISESRIEVEEYRGNVRVLNIAPGTVLLIDDTPAALKDFKAGMEIYGQYYGNTLTHLESWSTENPGYIPPGAKVRTGIIKNIDRNQLILQLTTGKDETYFTSPATIVLKSGTNVPLSTLYEGDRVKLYFDDKDTNIISRINIEGDSVKLKGLYKGILDAQNLIDNTILLKNVEVFQNGAWRELKNILHIDYTRGVPIYYGGQTISDNNLKYYKGKTVYIAVKDFFGKDITEQMVIKSLYESIFSEKIEEVNWYAQAFELKNKRNIGFDEGTIFVKNNRLVDGYALTPGQDAFVVADGRGAKALANVVYIYNQDLNNSNIGQYYLYSGKLDMVVENKVVLTDFFIQNQNEWESFDDEKELYYDNDTFIFDLEEMKEITHEEFITGHYAVDEDSSYARRHGLRSWYAYAYTDGDRIVAIALKKDMDSLLRQRVTIGTIERIEDDALIGRAVILRDARDWSSRNEKWMEKGLPVRMRVEESLLIKDDKMISWDELKPGDDVYCIRDDFECIFLLVK